MSCEKKGWWRFAPPPDHPMRGILSKLTRAGVETTQRPDETPEQFIARINASIEKHKDEPRNS